MKKATQTTGVIFALLLTAFSIKSYSQKTVFTRDIDNFWIAYDSVKTTKDTARQLQIIQSLYIDKGTEGLKSFIQVRHYTDTLYVKLINKYPKFWASIRPNTLLSKNMAGQLEHHIQKLKNIYPQLRPAEIYFAIGGLNTGGTTDSNKVLIGTEMAMGDSTVDVSEFKSKWYGQVFKKQATDNVVSLNIHEYIHTQQNGEPGNLLAQSIMEGSCDFMAELVMGKPMQTAYVSYGLLHEAELKEQFKTEMRSKDYSKWLYNGGDASTVADLGYFMGYQICKSYYRNAVDKKKAVKNIIELNYSDSNAVTAFLAKSKYYETAPGHR